MDNNNNNNNDSNGYNVIIKKNHPSLPPSLPSRPSLLPK